jgi:hypothetical protein
VDAACALAAGATALTDVEALTRQVEIYGPGGGASDTTVLRGLDELAERLGGSGSPGRRLSRAAAKARVRAWAAIIDRHSGLPAVRVAGTDLRRPCQDGQPGSAVAPARSRLVFPMTPGTPEKRTHDYVRHGTNHAVGRLQRGRRDRDLPDPPPPPGE